MSLSGSNTGGSSRSSRGRAPYPAWFPSASVRSNARVAVPRREIVEDPGQTTAEGDEPMIGANSAAEVPRGNLAGHPAVAIWSKLSGARNDPARIDVLRGEKKSATYRLVGAGPSGESIIAQRSKAPRAFVERT